MLASKPELIQSHELSELLLFWRKRTIAKKPKTSFQLLVFLEVREVTPGQSLAQQPHCMTFRVENMGVVFDNWKAGEKL